MERNLGCFGVEHEYGQEAERKGRIDNFSVYGSVFQPDEEEISKAVYNFLNVKC